MDKSLLANTAPSSPCRGLGERIVRLANSVGGKKKLAALSQIRESQLYRYINEENTPGLEALVAIADASGVSVDWLATGRESAEVPALGRSEGKDADGDGFKEENASNIPSGEYIRPPKESVAIHADPRRLLRSESLVDHLALRRDWIRTVLRRDPMALVLIEAGGDAMHPTIKPGDLVLADRTQAAVREDGLYALVLYGEIALRRVQRRRGGIKLLLDNTAYEAEFVSADEVPDLHVFGRVAWIGRAT